MPIPNDSDSDSDSWKDNMLGDRNRSQGNAKIQLFKRYYDITNTIITAGATNPNNQDSPVYNEERVHDALQRNAPFCRVINDGADNLYVLVSHGGEQTFSPENTIYPGDTKDYINVYTLRLRSPTAGLPYRVSEYDISRTCCPEETTQILKATIQNQALPAANTDFLPTVITPTFTPTMMLVQTAISVVGILSATITNSGNTQTVFFNAGAALAANGLYIFTLMLIPGDTMNIRYSVAGGVIQILRILELGEVV